MIASETATASFSNVPAGQREVVHSRARSRIKSMYAARTEYTAVSLPEAHAQIRRLKAELADKDHELQLYLHVAARATDEAERSSHGKLAAEVHDLR